MDRPALIALIVVLVALALAPASFAIDRWERANDYPFGRLCDAFDSCRQ